MGSDLGFGLRVGGISFSFYFLFSVDRWKDGRGTERWMDGLMEGWAPCHRSVGMVLIGSENQRFKRVSKYKN